MNDSNDKKRHIDEDFDEGRSKETFAKYMKLAGDDSKIANSSTAVSQAHDCVRMHLISNIEEFVKIPENEGFKVEYLHQIFGDNEEIKGYKNLWIDIYISRAQLLPYVQISYSSKEKDADDIITLLQNAAFPQGVLTDREKFEQILNFDTKFKPGGKKLFAYGTPKDPSAEYEIYENSFMTPGFADYMYRIESFVPFFIETGSFVEEESNLLFYLVYRRTKFNTYEFVGFANTFIYQFGLEKKRHRISQFMILPPYQRQGHGENLLELIYNIARSDSQCIEITVEECSIEFQGLRDLIDLKLSLKENCFPFLENYKNHHLIKSIEEYQKIKRETLPLLKQIKGKLKIIASQVRRIFEILLFSKIDTKNTQVMGAYEKDIKERLERVKREEFDPFSNRKLPYLCFEGKIEKLVPEKIYKRITKEKIEETLGVYFSELMEQYSASREKLNRIEFIK